MAVIDWYQDVKAVFDRYGVPVSVWGPILMVESGGDPGAVGDGGTSFGLFQAHQGGGQGDGYSVAQLKNPVINAEAVAPQIAGAVMKCGADDIVCIVANSQRPKPENYPKYAAAKTALGKAGDNLLVALTNWGGFQAGTPSLQDQAAGAVSGAVSSLVPPWLTNPVGTISNARHALILAALGVVLVIAGALGIVSGNRGVAGNLARLTPIGRVVMR